MSTSRRPDTPVASVSEAFAPLPAALQGHCPECREGNVFKSFFMLKETCGHCGVPFERDAGSYITSMVLNYFMTVICTTAIAFVLILRYGFFSGVTPLIAFIACAFIILLHRPSKVIYLWLMWVFGFIYHDRSHPDKRLIGEAQKATMNPVGQTERASILESEAQPCE